LDREPEIKRQDIGRRVSEKRKEMMNRKQRGGFTFPSTLTPHGYVMEEFERDKCHYTMQSTSFPSPILFPFPSPHL